MCTIHQPSIFLFQMFDQLLLLKRGGETVFFGDIGDHAHHLIAYFTAIPGTPAIAEGANPATWMLEGNSEPYPEFRISNPESRIPNP